ncbi:MAG: hypothetical protein ACI9Y7_000179 [Dokdonia sp.]|jgi:hypothetical protein
MSLIGTYTNSVLNATLEITEANSSNGQGKGTFNIGGKSYDVTIRYHFQSAVGPTTSMRLYGNGAGYSYFGASGSTADTSGNSGINIAGGVSTFTTTDGFSGMFTK